MTKEALGNIIIENQDCFYRVSKTILENDCDCKDAISQMIVKAFEKKHTLRKEEYVKSWLTRILINECYNILRAQKRINYLEDTGSDIEDCSNNFNEEYSELYTAISRLPENYRICITLYYTEGFSIKEIAKMLHSTESAIKKRLVRARASLKLAIEGYQDGATL